MFIDVDEMDTIALPGLISGVISAIVVVAIVFIIVFFNTSQVREHTIMGIERAFYKLVIVEEGIALKRESRVNHHRK